MKRLIFIILILSLKIDVYSGTIDPLKKIYKENGWDVLKKESENYIHLPDITKQIKIEIYNYLFSIAHSEKDFDSALKYIDILINLSGDSFKYILKKAALYYESHESKKADNLLLNLLKSKNLNIRQFSNIAQTFTKFGRYEKAISVYKQSQTKFNNRHLFNSSIGMLYEFDNNYKLALDTYMDYIVSLSNNSYIRGKIDNILKTHNLYDYFLKYLDNSKADISKNTFLLKTKALACYKLGKTEEMIDSYIEYLEITKDSSFLKNIVKKFEAAGRQKLARRLLMKSFRHLNSILKEDDFLFLLALTNVKSENFKIIMDYLEIYNNDDKKKLIGYYRELLKLYSTEHNADLSKEIINRIKKITELDYNEKLDLVKILFFEEKFEEADTVLSLIPPDKIKDSEYNYYLYSGLLNIFLNRMDKAVPLIKKTVLMKPSETEINFLEEVLFFLKKDIKARDIQNFIKAAVIYPVSESFPGIIDNIDNLIINTENKLIKENLSYIKGTELFNNNKLDISLEIFEKIFVSAENLKIKGNSLFNIAEIFIKLKQPEKSEKMLEQLIINYPDNLNIVEAKNILKNLKEEQTF